MRLSLALENKMFCFEQKVMLYMGWDFIKKRLVMVNPSWP
jgi:hypothetical protein